MPQTLEGSGASPGSGVGKARLLGAPLPEGGASEALPLGRRPDEDRAARAALERAAEEILELGRRMRAAGRDKEGAIVDTGALLARDPALSSAVSSLVLERGHRAGAAILEASQAQAAVIAQLEDPLLAERADDIRSVGRRAAALLEEAPAGPSGNGSTQVLVASDLGPADVAQLEPTVAGVALAGGGVSAHAAIVARSLGIPMVVGVGDRLLAVTEGDPLVIDGTSGEVILAPGRSEVDAATREVAERIERRARSRLTRDLPAVTTDGHAVRVLANAAGPAEVETALEAGAEGVGLLRTELAFLDAVGWPSEEEHRSHLAPILSQLPGRVATVRVLDFGGDKTPPFLRGAVARGIGLLLGYPEALEAQLRAILEVGGRADLRILLPLVENVRELDLARAALFRAADATSVTELPSLGAMIETSAGVAAASRIAAEVDFLSIGTNDLTHSILGEDRFSGASSRPHHPAVLEAIAATVAVAKDAGIPVEVCGEAASSSVSAPLLIGAGVDELSVGAARVGAVRGWVRSLSYSETRLKEAAARELSSPTKVESLVRDLSGRLDVLERGEAGGELVDSSF